MQEHPAATEAEQSKPCKQPEPNLYRLTVNPHWWIIRNVHTGDSGAHSHGRHTGHRALMGRARKDLMASEKFFYNLFCTISSTSISIQLIMAEVLAIPAGVVALVQAAQLVLGALSSLRGWMNAPAELLTVSEQIRHIDLLVCEIEHFVQTSQHLHTGREETLLAAQISQLKLELDNFGQSIRPDESHNTKAGRFKVRVRWMLGLEKKLAAISRQLEAHGIRLQTAFSLYTR